LRGFIKRLQALSGPLKVAWLLVSMAVLGAGLYALLAPAANLNPALSGFHLRGRTLALPNPGDRGP